VDDTGVELRQTVQFECGVVRDQSVFKVAVRPRPQYGLVVLLEAGGWPTRESVQPLSDPIQPAPVGELNYQNASDACCFRLLRRKKTLVFGGEVSERIFSLGHVNSIAY
jgi:hypothetical protein